MNVSSAAELQLYLEFAASALKKSAHGHESVGRKSPSIITDAAALRTVHRAEDIGSALKGGVKVCQRQLVNEVAKTRTLGPASAGLFSELRPSRLAGSYPILSSGSVAAIASNAWA